MLLLAPPCAIRSGEQLSLTHYQLLGIAPDERDPRVIEESALACMIRVRAYQWTHEAETTLRLNEIAQALITLLDPERRRQYDRSLDEDDGREALESSSPWPSRASAPRAATLSLLPNEGGACDVKLVYRTKTKN
jgi:hypothetical protein